jgi:5-(carboxyamino)imidazole ribonucleotide mutase/phosphoribosylaminoimidazole-succinocarboxamide synthase
MNAPLVVILMGSKADLPHCQKIADAARSFGLTVAMRIGSAHKTADHTLAILRQFEADPRPKVYITVAGRSNALSGFTDGAVAAPVIACPPASEAFGGADVYSSLRMPGGVAPAVVLEPANAALLAAKILALGSPQVLAAVRAFQQRQAEKIVSDDTELQTSSAAATEAN